MSARRKPRDFSNQVTINFSTGGGIVPPLRSVPPPPESAPPSPPPAAPLSITVNVNAGGPVTIVFDQRMICDLLDRARRGPPEERDDAFYAESRRHARPATGVELQLQPPYAVRPGTPGYDPLRFTLRSEFMRAAVMMSGAMKRAGIVERDDVRDFNHAGMYGFYEGKTPGTDAVRARIDAPRRDWDRAGAVELSYAILRMRAAAEMLNALPQVKFVKEEQKKKPEGKKPKKEKPPRDVLAPQFREQAALNLKTGKKLHNLLGSTLRGQFMALHKIYPAGLSLRASLKGIRRSERRAAQEEKMRVRALKQAAAAMGPG